MLIDPDGTRNIAENAGEIGALRETGPNSGPFICDNPDLARIAAAWPNLPAAIRQAIVALAGTVSPAIPVAQLAAGIGRRPSVEC
jgi:hypothetical protein